MSKEDGKGTLVVTYREDEGEVDRRRLAGIMGAATTVLMLVLIVALSLGMVGAALGVGMGGFVASFGEVDNPDDATIYPVLDEQAACDAAPQVEASLTGTAEVGEYVEFYKDLPLPDTFEEDDGTDRYARISIVSDGLDSVGGEDTVEVENLDLRLTALEAATLELGQGDIREFGPGNNDDGTADAAEGYSAGQTADDVEDSYVDSGTGALATDNTTDAVDTPEFGIDAGSFTLPDGGVAAAHQVSFDSITLQNLDLFVAIGNSTGFAEDSPVVERAVDPTERDCTSLADESGPGEYTDDAGDIAYPSYEE